MEKIISLKTINNTINKMFESTVHQKRILSLADAVYGALAAEKSSSSSMGRTLASLKNLNPKYAIKQIDRLLGNPKLNLEFLFPFYVRWVVGCRKNIVVSMDWTEYGYMGQSRIAINLVTKHGRATPLLWKTVTYGQMKHKMRKHEMNLLSKLKDVLSPREVRVTVLADRGFADTKLYAFIGKIPGWHYIIRFKHNVYLKTSEFEKTKASELVPGNGRIRHIPDVLVTQKNQFKVSSVVLVKKRDMKEAWYLVSNLKSCKERIVSLYSRRFTCEENFRDEKDGKFGLGFKDVIVTTTERRDRLLLIYGIATVLLTLLGSVSERLGYDKMIRANTSKTRTHSLFRQGRECFRGVAMYLKHDFAVHFLEALKNQQHTKAKFGII